MQALEELINHEEPGMALVRDWISQAKNPVTILQGDTETGEQTLLDLQVTSRSPMGAIALETGGILVDHGWVRVLGSGCPQLSRTISGWNRITSEAHRLPGALLVADDAVGGFFAINGGSLPGAPGTVCYLAPDSLDWEESDLTFSDWLWWLFTGDLSQYYQDARWQGWQGEIEALHGDQGFTIYPFLWTQGPPIGERSRKAVPIEELWELSQRFQAFVEGTEQ